MILVRKNEFFVSYWSCSLQPEKHFLNVDCTITGKEIIKDMLFPTSEAAQTFAFNAGYLKIYTKH